MSKKKVAIFIISTILILFLGTLIGLWYKFFYKSEKILINNTNFLNTGYTNTKLLDQNIDAIFSGFYNELLQKQTYSDFDEDLQNTGTVSKSNFMYQDVEFTGLNINPQLKELIKNIQKKPFDNAGYYFGVIYGLGSEEYRSRNLIDIVKIVVYNENTKTLITISLPRDLMINYDGNEMKIDFLYDNILKWKKDKKLAIEETTNFLSKYLDIPLNYYAIFDFDTFRYMIDQIGGINYCSPENVYWLDEKTKYYQLVVKKGCSKIDGTQALKIARTRKQDNDFYRSLRQTNLIKSIYESMSGLSYYELYSIFSQVLSQVQTNLNIQEIFYAIGNFQVKRNINIVLNAECNLDYGKLKSLKFCLLKNGGKKDDYKLYPLVDTSTISHYIKTIILYPEIFGCEVSLRGTFQDMINLKNVGAKIKNFRISKDWFQLINVNGCSQQAINYFLNHKN